MSKETFSTDSKFGKASEFVSKIEEITKRKVINNVREAEELKADIMIIAPCSRK